MRDHLNMCLDVIMKDIAKTKNLLVVYPYNKELRKEMKRLNRLLHHLQGAIEFLPDEPNKMPSIAQVLARFGAQLSKAGRLISPKGKETAITILQYGESVSYTDTKGNLLGSHIFSPHLVENFINKNWNWKKIV